MQRRNHLRNSNPLMKHLMFVFFPTWPYTIMASFGTSCSEELSWNIKFRHAGLWSSVPLYLPITPVFSLSGTFSLVIPLFSLTTFPSQIKFHAPYFKYLLHMSPALFSHCPLVWVLRKIQPWLDLILHLFWKKTHTAHCFWRNFIRSWCQPNGMVFRLTWSSKSSDNLIFCKVFINNFSFLLKSPTPSLVLTFIRSPPSGFIRKREGNKVE